MRRRTVCTALLAQGMEADFRALRARAPASEPLRRYKTVARILTGDTTAAIEDGIESVSAHLP